MNKFTTLIVLQTANQGSFSKKEMNRLEDAFGAWELKTDPDSDEHGAPVVASLQGRGAVTLEWRGVLWALINLPT